MNLPPPGTIWQRGQRIRRVIHAGDFTDKMGRTKRVVTYNNGGNENRRCTLPVWRRWAKLAEVIGNTWEEVEFELS